MSIYAVHPTLNILIRNSMRHWISQFVSLIKLGLIHPDLLHLAILVKRSGKTYLSYTKLFSLADNYVQVHKRVSQPLIAEFGVGRGGSTMILAWMVNRFGGYLTLFDVFGRIPPPSKADGEEALQRYQAILKQENESYYGNLSNLLDIIISDISTVCPLDRIAIIQGRYEDTLLRRAEKHSFDLVHIDCDWYESAKIVFSYLEGNLRSGAILQIDDYYYWQGAQKATDDAGWTKLYFRKAIGDALVIDTGEKTC